MWTPALSWRAARTTIRRFDEAIHAAYRQTVWQLCIAHLVRAALRYDVSTEDSQPVARDLKKIYQAATIDESEQALEDFAQAWDAKYPTIAEQWQQAPGSRFCRVPGR